MEKEIINPGVQFRDERTRVSFEKAEEILLSDRVQTIAEAEAEDEGVVLRRQYYICPDCGKEIPAFRSAFEKTEYVCPYGEDEICYLWKLLANADRTMQLLNICGTEFLPCLRIYPGSKKFLEDYAAAMGTEALSELLLAKPYCAIQYGIYYAAGSEERRAKERSQFSRSMTECFSRYELEAYEGYTGIPVPWNVSFGTEDRTPYACDGFLFRRITSSGGLRKAGKELSNCLAGYGGNSYIVGIYRRGRYVAALEIRTEESGKRVVVQAYEAHNKEIDKESRLGKAVQYFMEMYGLVYQDDEE